MLALNPAVKENLAKWQASSLARRKHGRAIYTRCRRFLLWMHAHNEAKLTSWQDVRPVLVDNFIKERLEPPAGSGFRPVSPGTVARDVAALREWLEWNEELELTGPIRSQYLVGRIVDKRQVDKFVLTDEQADWLLQRARWVKTGQTSLKFIEPGTGKRKSAWCAHWPEGAFLLFCRLGLVMGLRPRELFWLAWEDFTPKGDTAVLRVQDHWDGNKLINEVKRGVASARRLLLPAELWSELQAFRGREEQAGRLRRFIFAIEAPDRPCGWIKPEIHFIFKALKLELGDSRLVANTLRKTCGQRLRDKGLDYFAIAQFLGHSPTTCMRYYVQDCREDEAFDPATCKPVRLARVE